MMSKPRPCWAWEEHRPKDKKKMTPPGKGFFIWQIPRCGDTQLIADAMALGGFKHVMIKIADGDDDFGIVNGMDLAADLAAKLMANGIEAWGWQYVYLYKPIEEAAKACERIRETGVKGFVIDAETQCKGKPSQAHDYCSTLKAGVSPGFPIGLSSYRFPSLHLELPWTEFRGICDFDMPQVYWMNAHNPGAQLRRCVTEFSRFERKLPLVATGAAYREFGWQPTVGEVIEFMTVAGELGFGFNFWEWYDAVFVLKPIFDAITAWKVEEPPIPVDWVMVNTDCLNIRNAPVVNSQTVVGETTKGKIWEVSGRVWDGMGRMWVQSGPTAHMAGWLVKEI